MLYRCYEIMIDRGKIGCHWRAERHERFVPFKPSFPDIWQMDLSKLVLINEVKFVFTSVHISRVVHDFPCRYVRVQNIFLKANRYTIGVLYDSVYGDGSAGVAAAGGGGGGGGDGGGGVVSMCCWL